MEGNLLHLLVEGKEDSQVLQLPVLLHNQVEGGKQVDNHQQPDMLEDILLPLLEAVVDSQDTPAVLQGIHLPVAAWDRAVLLVAWALHTQGVVH